MGMADRVMAPDDGRRSETIIAFLGAGLHQPPTRAAALMALAQARGTVAARQVSGESLNGWLAGEIKVRGIRENAAVLAVMEVPGQRESAARAYASEHPDRVRVLNDMLALLT